MKLMTTADRWTKKSNEITAFKPLLEPMDLEGRVVTADAMHTQVEYARFNKDRFGTSYVCLYSQFGNQSFESAWIKENCQHHT